MHIDRRTEPTATLARFTAWALMDKQ